MKRHILIAVLLAVGIQSVFAADFSSVSPSGHTLYYNINDANFHTLTVTYPAANWVGYTKPTGTLIIPDTVVYLGVTYTVDIIGEDAFNGCSGITGVNLPNTLLIIENNAFYHCNISNINIPSSVGVICSGAFIPYNSGIVNSISVSDNVEHIEYGAFQCSGYWFNSKPNGIIYLGKIAYCYKGSFSQNMTLVFADGTKGITSIDEKNNQGGSNHPERITSVVFPSSLRRIGYGCFEGCANLQSVSFPDSLQDIGPRSFYGCGSLSQITIPRRVLYIGEDAFSQCGNLSIVNYNAFIASIIGYSIHPHSPFSGCENLTTANIGDSVYQIPANLFAGCTHLSTVNMSDSVVQIGSSAFANTAITTFTIPRNLNSMGNTVFSGCSSLCTIYYNAINFNNLSSYTHPFGNASIENIVFGGEVQNIPNYLCYNMTSLQGFSFPNGLRRIGDYAFYGCTGLSGSLSLPSHLEHIGSHAFSGCTGLSGSLVLSGNLQYIGSSAFNGCAGFTGGITIPNSTAYVGSNSFSYCNGITSVTIGQNVDTMGSAFANMANLNSVVYNAIDCSYATGAFSGNTNVTNLTIGNTVRRIPEMTIYGLPNIATISIPEGLTHIGQNNFSSMAITGDVILPSTLAEIGYGAFTGCYGIDRVICNAINPPIVTSFYGQSYIFSGCTTKPLLVPCESINAYRNTPGWNNFTNISGIGNCGFTISALSGTPSGGYVEGGGVYNEGEQCTLSAIAYNGYRFDHWDDYSTQNPRTFIVSEYATFIAYFVATQGIEDVPTNAIIACALGGQIVVETKLKEEIVIYDIVGRKVDGGRKTRFDVPAAGVYLVKIGSLPTQKVVVVK